MTGTDTAPKAVSVRLPERWMEIDPREPDLGAELLRTAREHLGDVDEEHVLRYAVPVAEGLRDLVEGGSVLLAGFYADFLPVEGTDVPLLVTANAVLALFPPAAGGLDAVRRELAARAADDMEIRSVTLPVGRAVTTSANVPLSRPEWTAPVRGRLRRYFVPVPGLDRVAVLSMLTPNEDLVEAFDEVFAAIASTLRFE
ncbi:hypothetical protein [Saccharothrix longispora]|uniref:hypothetical protein n=1 Tax=Saccharothrix longispora TaxID=33920 RepID=UPI0028FD265F|nr:hypothetical protein [Saccharothrix longispora]MDU0292961.1 hypothetical protein [Saccharothrix longispora]